MDLITEETAKETQKIEDQKKQFMLSLFQNKALLDMIDEVSRIQREGEAFSKHAIGNTDELTKACDWFQNTMKPFDKGIRELQKALIAIPDMEIKTIRGAFRDSLAAVETARRAVGDRIKMYQKRNLDEKTIRTRNSNTTISRWEEPSVTDMQAFVKAVVSTAKGNKHLVLEDLLTVNLPALKEVMKGIKKAIPGVEMKDRDSIR